MSYPEFKKWMKNRKSVTVHMMDGTEILVKVEIANIRMGDEINNSHCPVEFKVVGADSIHHSSNWNTVMDIGSRYINQIIETGEYWSVFVDGYQHYLISECEKKPVKK